VTDVPAAVVRILEDELTSRGIEQLVEVWRMQGARTEEQLVRRASAWLTTYEGRTGRGYYR
jgi:hypothetical protein